MGLFTNYDGSISRNKVAFWIVLGMIFVAMIATVFFQKVVDLPMYGLLGLVFIVIFLDRRNSRSTSIGFAGMTIQQNYGPSSSEKMEEKENGD